jgi:phosphate transport system permease protein
MPSIIAGTFVIGIIAMLVAAPLGLGAAVYLAEYAAPRVRRTVKPILEILAAIPSVVLGFFALSVLSPALIDPICPGATPIFNMAAAGVAVGVLITPLVASIAEDAMYAVPDSLREASYGLGARKRVTSLRIVVPAAVSGIVASLIVGFSRAIGETMIVAIVAGGVGGAVFSLNPCLPGQTMTAAMTSLAVGSDQAAGGVPVASLFFVGLLLFVMTLTLNLISERFVRRIRASY